jgi:DNA helicase-2/ATP-dependent DNA helicase PcrA
MLLQDFLSAIDLMVQFHLPIKEKELGVTESGVQLMTAHASKGLEFAYVFVPQLVSGKWDHKRHIAKLELPPALMSEAGETDALEEDRRLLYVAITRAKKRVYLSYSAVYASSYGKDKEVHKSQFLDELPRKHILKLNVKKYTQLVQEHLAELLAKRPYNSVYINTVDEKEIIKGIVSRFELHPTGLNNYIECPMRFLLSNILRIPSAMSPALAYGNAVHAALEGLYKSKKTSLVPLSPTEFVDIFNKKLVTYPLRTSQQEKLVAKGKEDLLFFYDQHINTLVAPVKTEHKLSGVVSGARIKGRVDRIDYIDSSNKFLRVIDYKTGKSVSASAFDGLHPSITFHLYDKEKAKAQRYFNQLLFYKVVSDIDWWITSNTAEVMEGTLLFVDPVREKFEERTVAYQQSDVQDMREIIIDVWQKIQRLEFPRVHDEDDNCEYCKI